MQSQILPWCDSQLSRCLISTGSRQFPIQVFGALLAHFAVLPGPDKIRFEECKIFATREWIVYTSCLIKPGPPRTQTRRQDTLTTLDRKRNTNAQTRPGHSRWHERCPVWVGHVPATRSVGVRKRQLGWRKRVRKGGRSRPSIAKRTEPVYMIQIISAVFLLYFEEDWLFFSFDYFPTRQGEKSGAMRSGHIYQVLK